MARPTSENKAAYYENLIMERMPQLSDMVTQSRTERLEEDDKMRRAHAQALTSRRMKLHSELEHLRKDNERVHATYTAYVQETADKLAQLRVEKQQVEAELQVALRENMRMSVLLRHRTTDDSPEE